MSGDRVSCFDRDSDDGRCNTGRGSDNGTEVMIVKWLW